MPISAKPYRQKTFATVKGNRMAYIELRVISDGF